MNPHVLPDTRSLVLPVCQFQHLRATKKYYHRDSGLASGKIKKFDQWKKLIGNNTAMDFVLTIHDGTVT